MKTKNDTKMEKLFKEKRSKNLHDRLQLPGNEGTAYMRKWESRLLQDSKKAKKSVPVKAYSPSDDDFVKDAFTGKKNEVSKVLKRKRDNLVTETSSKTKKSSSSKPVLSDDIDSKLHQKLRQPGSTFDRVLIKSFPGPLFEVIKDLFEVIKDLTDDQKEAVTALGFGSMLEFGINTMPSRLGYWLLKRFDAETGTLKVFGKSIEITPEVVHQTTGLPMGVFEVEIRDVLKERGNTVYQEFKNQFNGLSRLYANKHLLKRMKIQIKRNDAGRLFQLNFLVMFSTIMAHVVSTGTLNLSIIPSLSSLENVKEMDWCEYMLDYLKSQRSIWKGGKTRFFGPLLLLELIFANSCLKNPEYPAFKYWKTDLIIELDEMMFGKDRKKMVKKEDTDEEQDMDDEEEEEMDDVGANEIQNDVVPSKKPKMTKTLVKELRTTEKKTTEAELMPAEDETVLIKTMCTKKKKVKVDDGQEKQIVLVEEENIYEVEKADKDVEKGTRVIEYRRKLKRKSMMTELEREEHEFEAEIGEKEPLIDGDITSVHIDDIGEQQWSNEDMIDSGNQMIGTDESVETRNPLTGTDGTEVTETDEQKSLSSDSIKITQQLSAMVLEFQGIYSQFKSPEEFDHSLRNMLTIFQELKTEIDDMLRAALEKYPRHTALLGVQEWMNRLVNRVGESSKEIVVHQSQFEGEEADLDVDEDGSEHEPEAKETDEHKEDPQTDEPTQTDEPIQTDEPTKTDEPTLTQMFNDPEFVKDFERIEGQKEMKKQEFPLFNISEVEKNKSLDIILYEKTKPVISVDELIANLSFLNPSSVMIGEAVDKDTWPKILKDASKVETTEPEEFSTPKPKLIMPISFVSAAPEQKLKRISWLSETPELKLKTTQLSSFNTIAKKLKMPDQKEKMQKEEDLGKRQVKPTEALKSPYLQRVVVMKNKPHDNEKKVAETIFSAQGNVDDIIFKSYFFDGLRIHFESLQFGNEVIAAVIDMWTHLLNMGEKRKSPQSLKKLFCNTAIITKKMMQEDVRKTSVYNKFEENMNNVVFQSNYESILEIDLVFFPMLLNDEHYYVVCFNLKDPQIHVLDNMLHNMKLGDRYGRNLGNLKALFLKFLSKKKHPRVANLKDYKLCVVEMPWRTQENVIDCGIFAMRHMETYQGSMAKYDAGFVPEGKEQEEQIRNLRMKYLTKILLSDSNENKEGIEKEVQAYLKLDLKTRKKLQQESVEAINSRISDYFDIIPTANVAK